ncbi:MAG TPA: hypothetical protein VFX50_05420, partial [Gemmatimonadales bacterium]|nr:hypothetical protein [Gemmatimonadales bacterium]
VLDVEDGGFFRDVGGSAVFTPRIDPGVGIVFATAGASGAGATKGDAALAKVRMKSLKAGTSSTLQIVNLVAVDSANQRVPIQGATPLEIRTQP